MLRKLFVKPWVVSGILLAFVWIIFTGGNSGSWIIGVPAIAIALYTQSLLPKLSKFSLCWKGVIPFFYFFLKNSLLGGIDVALRAFQPRCQIAPGFITFRFKIVNQIARVYFINVVSLMPGTLSADLVEGGVLIHLIDVNLPNQMNLELLEQKVGALFKEKS